MRRALAAFFASTWLVVVPALADTPRIGLAAPLTGSSERLGWQVVHGAEAAAEGKATLEVADDTCSSEGGAAAARQFVGAGVAIAVGFLCSEAIEAALPILKEARIPVVTPGVRAEALTDMRARTGNLVWRLAPRAESESLAISAILTAAWRDKPFAILDDGTIHARELAEAFRSAAEGAGQKPVLVDTFRPQLETQGPLVERLRQSGATHVFVAGDRDDVAIITRDAAALPEPPVFAGGESLRAAPGPVPLAAGTLMVGLPEWSETADPALLSAFAARSIAPEGYVLPAYAATEVSLKALAEPDPAKALSGEFRTVIGPVAFDAKGDLAQNPFRLFTFDGTGFRPVETQ